MVLITDPVCPLFGQNSHPCRAFFLNLRRSIAEHSDTVAIGPTIVANYLAARSSK
jgi:hypothetical protein